MNKFTSMSKEEYLAAKDGFLLQYAPPTCDPVETMDMVMRKENAEAIIKGERKVVFHTCDDNFFNLLHDEEVNKWMMEQRVDEDMDIQAMYEFVCSTRPVQTIHFHDDDNSWYLNVECTKNDLACLFRQDVEFLQKRFGCHDLDGILEDYEKKDSQMRPAFFYFALGKILDTNLVS